MDYELRTLHRVMRGLHRAARPTENPDAPAVFNPDTGIVETRQWESFKKEAERALACITPAIPDAYDLLDEPHLRDRIAGANRYAIFTDGSSSFKAGNGGWAVVVRAETDREGEEPLVDEFEYCGADPHTTNNRMEMSAVLYGLRLTPRGAIVKVVSDSEYVVVSATQHLRKWKMDGWRTSTGKPVSNRDLWERLDVLMSRRTLHWEWVRGHNGHPENERADRLASKARKTLVFPVAIHEPTREYEP